jgi:hypothetical protein
VGRERAGVGGVGLLDHLAVAGRLRQPSGHSAEAGQDDGSRKQRRKPIPEALGHRRLHLRHLAPENQSRLDLANRHQRRDGEQQRDQNPRSDSLHLELPHPKSCPAASRSTQWTKA